MNRLTRREFLRLSAVTASSLITSYGLSACSSNGSGAEMLEPAYEGLVSFANGVASGDPLADSVIIWTRALPDTATELPVRVRWQVATDEAFLNIEHDEAALVTADTDHTLKIDVKNLQSGMSYYYRFISNSVSSATGKTATLPTSGVEKVSFAVVSCSNYPTGYFNVYREIVNRAPDVVLHLGDYIYEYGDGEYGTEMSAQIGRALPADNNGEILSLADYRKRYALYRSDEDLQALHAAAPMIAVWDDHEVTNDTWAEGAQNHNEDPATDEGDFFNRRQQAFRAYFEWMPIRPASEGNFQTIYRQFEFGDLINLLMLDTRNAGRDEQVALENYIDPTSGVFNAIEYFAAINDVNRSLLGAEQRQWLQDKVSASSAIWQVLGQQVLMGRMYLPAEVLLNPTDPTVLPNMVGLKVRALQGDPSLTESELQRLNTQVPYNPDAWDGYEAEREMLLELMAGAGKRLITLAGDTHNAWSNNLLTAEGVLVGTEFATASVTSPGLEAFLGITTPEAAAQTEIGLVTLIDGLVDMNVSQRGFMTLTITREDATAEWTFIDNISSRDYVVDTARSMSRTIVL